MAERDNDAGDEYDRDLRRQARQESGSSGEEPHGMSEMAGPSAGGVPPETDLDARDARSQTAGQAPAQRSANQPPDRPRDGKEPEM